MKIKLPREAGRYKCFVRTSLFLSTRLRCNVDKQNKPSLPRHAKSNEIHGKTLNYFVSMEKCYNKVDTIRHCITTKLIPENNPTRCRPLATNRRQIKLPREAGRYKGFVRTTFFFVFSVRLIDCTSLRGGHMQERCPMNADTALTWRKAA